MGWSSGVIAEGHLVSWQIDGVEQLPGRRGHRPELCGFMREVGREFVARPFGDGTPSPGTIGRLRSRYHDPDPDGYYVPHLGFEMTREDMLHTIWAWPNIERGWSGRRTGAPLVSGTLAEFQQAAGWIDPFPTR